MDFENGVDETFFFLSFFSKKKSYFLYLTKKEEKKMVFLQTKRNIVFFVFRPMSAASFERPVLDEK